MSLDLSKFSKVDSDDKCTTLAHPNGHMIKVAHKGLSKELKKQLEELPVSKAAGGPLEPRSGSHSRGAGVAKAAKPQGMAENAFTEPDQQNSAQPPLGFKQEQSSEERYQAHQDTLVPPKWSRSTAEQYPPCINPSCKSYGSSHPNCRCYGGIPEHVYAEGGDVKSDHFCSEDRPHKEGCEYFKDGGESGSESDKLAAAKQEIEAENPAGAAPINPNPEVSGGPAVPAPPEAPAPIDPYAQADQDAKNTEQWMHDQSNKFYSDVDAGHIAPETYGDYFAKRDLGGKLSTLFGLMISGAGAGLAGGPNEVMGMMDNEIKRDLEAQEKSAENKRSLMSINGENLNKMAAAGHLGAETRQMKIAMAQDQANYMYYNKFAKYVNGLPPGSPQQAQAQQQLLAMGNAMTQQKASAFAQAARANAVSKVMGNLTGGGGGQLNTQILTSGLAGEELKPLGQDIEAKTVPGFAGQASAPMSSSEKDELRNGATFDSAMKDLEDWVKQHPKGALPGSPEDKRGRALAGIVQGKFREATKGGVYKSGEQDFINKLVPEDPTQLFNAYRVLPKIQSVRKEMANQTDAKARSYGLKGYSGFQQEKKESGGTIERLDKKTGKVVLYDSKTKKPLRFK